MSNIFIIIITIIVAGKNPVSEGEVSTIEIQRGEDDQLNISIVGGADTPLVSPVFSCLHSGFFFSLSLSLLLINSRSLKFFLMKLKTVLCK